MLQSANVDKNHRNVSVVDVLRVEKLDTHPKTLVAKIFPQLCHALSFKKFHFPYVFESVSTFQLAYTINLALEYKINIFVATPEIKI